MSNRDQYLEKFKAQLDQWNADLSKLEARAREMSADARLQIEHEIQDLRQRRDEARERYKELEKAGEHSWNDLRTRSEQAWNDLAEGFRRAWSHFK